MSIIFMRQLKFILFSTAFLLFISNAILADDGKGSASGSITLIRGRGNSSPTRPKVPTNQLVSCDYVNGLLTIEFKYSEGSCEVALTDVESGMELFYTMDSEELIASFFVGEIGEFTIEISTESGNTYSGTLIP